MIALLLTLLAWGGADESVPLASQLVQDGHHARAQSVLDSLDESLLGEFAARYYTVSGVIALQSEEYMRARDEFHVAVEFVQQGQEGADVGLLQLYIAQCSIALRAYEQAIRDLSTADQSGHEYWVLLATAHKGLEDAEAYYYTVNEGLENHPNNLDLSLKSVDSVLWLGMVRQGFQMGSRLLERPELDAQSALQLAYAFQQHSAPSEAYWLLKTSTGRYSDSAIWIAASAQAIETKRFSEAADMLLVLAEQDPNYAIEAAEAYRQAGAFGRALYANTLATDGEDKVRQRLGLYIASEDFVEACALVPRLNRWNILKEDPVKYGLAYAFFKLGDFDSATQYVQGITDISIFQQAASLRSAISVCETEGCQE
ncbi:MAG: hypothetical protein VXZ96_15480 [Myxococcota bacterium]|nr:hypothetical protein [Myxococcota bacterium]